MWIYGVHPHHATAVGVPAATESQAHVPDALSGPPEEHEVSHPRWGAGWKGAARKELVVGIAGERRPLLPQHLLRETGAIERRRRPSTPLIGHAEQAAHALGHARGSGAGVRQRS